MRVVKKEETTEDIAKSILFLISSALGMRGIGHGYTAYGMYKDCTIKFKCGFVTYAGWVEDLTIYSETGTIHVHSEQAALPIDAFTGDGDINKGKVVSTGSSGITKADVDKVRTAIINKETKAISWLRAFIRNWWRI